LYWSFRRDAEAEQSVRHGVETLEGLLKSVGNGPGTGLYRTDLAHGYTELAHTLGKEGLDRPAEAEDADRQAVAVWDTLAAAFPAVPAYRHRLARSLTGLGNHASDRGRLEEAVAAYRRAITTLEKLAAEYPGEPGYRASLSDALGHMGSQYSRAGRTAEAEAALREAIRLQPGYLEAYNNLGHTFVKQGKLAEAEAAYRKAIELRPGFAPAYNNLGHVLKDQGKAAEAVACYRKAIELKPDYALAYFNLGLTLDKQGKPSEAEAAYRKAIELQPDSAETHYALGLVLAAQGKLGVAEAAYRQAIELKPDYAEAHCNLAGVLRRQGRFTEALAAVRRGHELGSQQPGWRYPSAQWVRQAERDAALEPKLTQVLMGKAQPADAAERLELARLCRVYKQLYVAAARLSSEAFAEEPARADDLTSSYRYNAACAAALAAAGQGRDVKTLGAEDRTRLRRQALAWLRADLTAWGQQLDRDPDQARPHVVKAMQHWQGDTDFTGVRGPEALGGLPSAERPEWQKLWEDVAALQQRAAGPPHHAGRP
jgi:tetratricopeptide (TPR) repeat protein